ncbi:hypothetical protein N7468_006161 [Penicillium chermesinum]|uniref:chitinase n=1 Tax=Penicillium chermesinum TaxID=63820 RepID=A0A9W9NS39_9EURO|nr:uncharacterized protein N7468_006161 [Penicillium chermesinum]KAJ5224936.1 hypothetical protein N7468_006161 [Penicillium chermesinum]
MDAAAHLGHVDSQKSTVVGCMSNCNATAECGKYSKGNVGCPLGVCCSFAGFCGTTSEFCGDGCQSGCKEVDEPSCDSHTDIMKLDRRVAYYELFNMDNRKCDKYIPEHIPAGGLTHLNLAFAVISDKFEISEDDSDLVTRAAHLKDRFEGLRVNIAIGGWDFNDGATATIWSDLVADYQNTQTFMDSLVAYLKKYGLDGVDLDWEYPVAEDRGGAKEDYGNYVTFVARLRERFDQENPGWEISITLPASYWYLRGFDVEQLQKYISYFNLMSYDFHGLWDKHNDWTGPYLKGHTNLTEAKQGLDLLWRNNVKPENVVMGFGFYGRSFTMLDSTCHDPNEGCQFSTAGLPGDCSDTAGILTYAEIRSRNNSLNTDTYYDEKSTTKYMTYSADQWISYDDEESFTAKKKFLTSQCLSGLMIWAIDQDTQDYDAINALFGDAAMDGALTRGGELSDEQKEKLTNEFASFNGQNCFVTELCTDGSSKESGPKQKCPSGTSSVSTAHAPLQKAGTVGLIGQCSEGWYRHVCCPNKQMPSNCQWNVSSHRLTIRNDIHKVQGEPVRSEVGCSGKCGDSQFELATDTFTDALGEGQCFQGHRSLCCDSTELLHQCYWSGCEGPLMPYQSIGELGTPGCKDGYESVASRFDTDDGGWCSREFSSDLHDRFKRGLCCPKSKKFDNCRWTTQDAVSTLDDATCQPRQCKKTQTKISEAYEPMINPYSAKYCKGDCTVGDQCAANPILPEFDPAFYLCCDPPSQYNEDWPVPPSYLWEDAYEDDGDDVAWAFADNQGNNDDQSTDDPIEEDPSDHAYGFLMLDGPPESIDNAFGDSYTVARRSSKMPNRRRSMITTNTTILDSTFDHAEETMFVYCNYPKGSPECEKIFRKGAEDTIIKLPDHVGEGPFARVVSMAQASDTYELPHHHVRARSAENNENEVYELKIDYNFHLIKRNDGPVNMRIDYTNLLPYWDEVTDSKPSSKKRSVHEKLTKDDWKSFIKDVKTRAASNSTSVKLASGSTDMMETADTGLAKRWFGKFVDWLKKMNTVEAGNDGVLNMAFQKSFLLYRAVKGCARRTFYAEMRMYLDADVQMDATYAYYLSGTIVPLKVDDTYGYLGVEPSAYLGLRLKGNAIMTYTSDWRKLIDTLAYPGLSIKGIATVGPSLDIYGRNVVKIRGSVTLSGQAKAGARVHFGRAELYFPQDEDGTKGDTDYDKIENIKSQQERPKTGLEPQFYASAQASANLAIDVSPSARIGIEVGPAILGKGNLVDAQIIAFLNSTLDFSATVTGSIGTDTDPTYTYKYGAYLYYNLGYGGYANILGGTWNWHFTPVYLYSVPGNKYTIYENSNVESDATLNSKRDVKILSDADEKGLFHDDYDDALSADSGLEPYVPPASHFHHRRNHMHLHRKGYGSNDGKSNATSPIPDAGSIIFKRADSDDGTNPDTAGVSSFTGSQKFDCPKSGNKQPTLPEFRYNCQAFSANQVVTTDGSSQTVRGICDGIFGWFGSDGASSDGVELTWDPDRRQTRDAYTCNRWRDSAIGKAKSYCTDQKEKLNTAAGLALLSTLYTNVAYFDRDSKSDEEDWKLWSRRGARKDERWTPGGSEKDKDPPAFGRLTRYPEPVPLAHGIDETEWENSGRTLGYNFKRNFTMSLAYATSLSNTPDQWGKMALTDSQIPGGAVDKDPTHVFCAINLFNQPKVYRYGTGNGYCLDTSRNNGWRDERGFGKRPEYKMCKVNFAGSKFADQQTPGSYSKRDQDDSIGGNDPWEIESIELLDEEDELPPWDDADWENMLSSEDMKFGHTADSI